MSSVPDRSPRLRAVTREIDATDAIDDTLEYADAADPIVWSRRGDILVGTGGAAAQYRVRAEDSDPSAWWQGIVASATIDDPIGIPGTGLVAFGAFPFDRRSEAEAILTVPSIVLGRRGGRSWITRIGPDDHTPAASPRPVGYGPHWSATLGPGALTPEGYQGAVREGLAAIAAGDVAKVVLARDLAGSVPADADLRRLVRALASAYPDTWTYAMVGLIGASPETLVTVSGGTVTARVLAGTAARGADADADTTASVALATSTKDLDEHQFAVQSVLTALRPHTTALVSEEQPFMLKLPNVWHLATDVEGTLAGNASALDLVAVLHPTAAVAGTPTAAAIDVIDRLEPFDRGRYAGPVGWIDAHGDGEWAIALRCAQFHLPDPSASRHQSASPDPNASPAAPAATDPSSSPAGTLPFTAYAGAGIVAGSDPEAEMLETRVKFRPIIDALA